MENNTYVLTYKLIENSTYILRDKFIENNTQVQNKVEGKQQIFTYIKVYRKFNK